MTKLSPAWPIVIICTTIVVSLLTYVFPDTVLQPLLMLWFLLICPGMAWVRLIRLDGTIVELSLALGLSISLDTLVVFAFLYSNAWSIDGILITLLIVSCAGAVVQLASRSSVFSVFYRRINARQGTATSLASISSFAQQEMQTRHLPTLSQAPISQHIAEMPTQRVPSFPSSRSANNGKEQPIEKLDTVRMPALPTPAQKTQPHVAEMQTQSVPSFPPAPGAQRKEDTHLDEIHTQMLPVPTPPPPSKKPRKGLMSFVPPTPTLPAVPPTPTLPFVPPTPKLSSVPSTPKLPFVPPTPTLPFDEPTPEKPVLNDTPIRDKDKNALDPSASPAPAPARKDAIDTVFFDLVHTLLSTSQDATPEKQPSPIPSTSAATPKDHGPEGTPQAPRTPHPLLVEQDENKQDLDAFVDDEDDDTAKTPSVIATPPNEQKKK